MGRAASKAANALISINKGGLHIRQQAFTPGNPQYLAAVVSWACDTVSPDLQDTCVTDLTAAILDSTVPYCASAQNELTICLVDQPQDCSDSQVSFDDCANFTIATYDYCIGLGYTTLPELPDCANSELQGTPVNPYDGSSATTTDNWYGYTDGAAASTDGGYDYTDGSAATTTDDWYDYTDSAATTTDDYGYGYTESSTPATITTTHASSSSATSKASPVIITTSTPIAVPTTQLITYITIIGTTTIRVTNTTVVPTTIFSLETLTSATRTAVQNTTTIVSTYPTTHVTTTTVSGSAVPVTVTSSVVSTIYSCAGGCTHPTTSPPLEGSLCVRRSRVRLVEQSSRASSA